MIKKIKGEEFIIVSRYNTPLFLKSLLRPADELTKKMNKEAMEMINKAEIFQFNAKLDLIEMDIRYIDGKQLWIDGIKIMDMSHR